jgi:hypothetical protein
MGKVWSQVVAHRREGIRDEERHASDFRVRVRIPLVGNKFFYFNRAWGARFGHREDLYFVRIDEIFYWRVFPGDTADIN